MLVTNIIKKVKNPFVLFSFFFYFLSVVLKKIRGSMYVDPRLPLLVYQVPEDDILDIMFDVRLNNTDRGQRSTGP